MGDRESRPVNTTVELTSTDWNEKINHDTMLEGFSDIKRKLKAVNYREMDINIISSRLILLEAALNSSTITSEQQLEFEIIQSNLLTRKLNLLNEILELKLNYNSMTLVEIEEEISLVKIALK
ncbi:MAG: hypothetical protein ACI9J3_002056 [Parvicellaceae bacterium]|jgi:hypothetical protein